MGEGDFLLVGQANSNAPLSLGDDEHVGEEEEAEALAVDPPSEGELGDGDGAVAALEGALPPRDARHLLEALDEPARGRDERHGATHLLEVELLRQDQQLLHPLHRASSLVAFLHQLRQEIGFIRVSPQGDP